MNELHVGFTATREGLSPNQLSELAVILRSLTMDYPPNHVFAHHGDCIGGDYDFHQVARKLKCVMEGWPPTNPTHRAFCDFDIIHEPMPYLDRDRHMVNRVHILIAGPRTDQEELRSGTWATIRYARKIGRPRLLLRR